MLTYLRHGKRCEFLSRLIGVQVGDLGAFGRLVLNRRGSSRMVGCLGGWEGGREGGRDSGGVGENDG